MSELNHEERAFLDALRSVDEPSAEDRMRVRKALYARLAVGVVAGAAATTSTTASASIGSSAAATGGSAVASSSALIAKTMLAVCVLGSTGAGAHLVYKHYASPLPTIVTSQAVNKGSSPSADEGTDASLAAPFGEPHVPSSEVLMESSVSSDSSEVPRERPGPSVPVYAPSVHKDSESLTSFKKNTSSEAHLGTGLHAELSLMQQAQRALRDGETAHALELLKEHEAMFPHGALREEQNAARAIALCQAGRTEEGQAEAQRFLRESPASLLRDRVSSACFSKEP